jgi:hypothetical protein
MTQVFIIDGQFLGLEVTAMHICCFSPIASPSCGSPFSFMVKEVQYAEIKTNIFSTAQGSISDYD